MIQRESRIATLTSTTVIPWAWHYGDKSSCQVANPPYSAKCLLICTHGDEDSTNTGKHAPKARRFAFVQHMVYHRDEEGRAGGGVSFSSEWCLFRVRWGIIRKPPYQKLNCSGRGKRFACKSVLWYGIPVCFLFSKRAQWQLWQHPFHRRFQRLWSRKEPEHPSGVRHWQDCWDLWAPSGRR